MTDLYSILVANASTWGIALTLIIAFLLLAVVFLYRDNRRQDGEIKELRGELEKMRGNVDEKVSDLYDLVNGIARDVAFIKGRMEKE